MRKVCGRHAHVTWRTDIVGRGGFMFSLEEEDGEFIHTLVETMDRYFENVCELDIMFHIEKAHFIVDEMVLNGCIVETNKSNILDPVLATEKA
eukprot:CAMPEP_0175990096 /NCGR_PEP_ID=MMETSP0108-20121206/52114_1 /TAXON_ID=195067 ORGANISM="Goniomonas pacifica, Strain CCMP1869" /NCGR_SAMPLE_ID=MMETSP0108 /ASSEMBLY_ACC=CAM_ASM_000204 /LENGTH=92 /DNA_ID=CAMNT_0017321525 /DNA_START=225 /DNA_END=503 /DNA_ORIENTATION=-